MREIAISEVVDTITQQLRNGGVLLCSADGARRNVMTIGWGGLTVFFNDYCFLAPVRESRHTYGLLMKNGAFTVNVPLTGMRAELKYAGSASGRDEDKFTGHGLTAAPALEVNVPIVKECGLHIECLPLGHTPLRSEQLEPEVLKRWYPSGDLHTLFLGKVVRCYLDD